ncbi:MAG: hypothetical protein KC964_06515 [Candidatus Omnitrophica bacterium]|nr:hypothetical protein [Candidatus Omnitrophota bacterium]
MEKPDNQFEQNVERVEWLLLIVATVFLLLNTFTTTRIDNDKSRMATVDSLVKRGTWVIEESRFHKTDTPVGTIIDKVQIDGHFYSSKPPVFPFLMAGEYWVLHKFGLDFEDDDQLRFLVWILTFTFTGIPFLLIGLLFKISARWFIEDPLIRLVGLFTILWGNELMGFAQTVNNHVPAAFLFFAAMVGGLGLVHGKLQPKPIHFIWTGLAAGLLPTVDIPACFFCVPLWIYLVRAFPTKTLIWFTLGAAPPLVLHFILNYKISGGLLPFYLNDEYYQWQGSYWDRKMAMDAAGEYETRHVNFFHSTVGRKGLFSLYPVLIFSAVYVLWCLSRTRPRLDRVIGILYLAVIPALGYVAWAYNQDIRVSHHISFIYYMLFAFIPFFVAAYLLTSLKKEVGGRPPALALEGITMGALTLMWLIFYCLMRDNYGGSATGYRWFMFFVPSLQFFGILALAHFKSRGAWLVACILIGLSFYASWQATVQPWSMNYDWPTRFLGGWITRF